MCVRGLENPTANAPKAWRLVTQNRNLAIDSAQDVPWGQKDLASKVETSR